jgi:hypothetical protein
VFGTSNTCGILTLTGGTGINLFNHFASSMEPGQDTDMNTFTSLIDTIDAKFDMLATKNLVSALKKVKLRAGFRRRRYSGGENKNIVVNVSGSQGVSHSFFDVKVMVVSQRMLMTLGSRLGCEHIDYGQIEVHGNGPELQ